MFKQIKIKNEYLLIAGTILFLLLSYQLSFKNTIDAWQLNRRLNKQLANVDLSYQPAYEARKNHNLDVLLNLYKADTLNFRSNIISTISGIASKENVKLTEVPVQDPFFNTDKFIVHKLNFEGDYFSMLKVLNRLQSATGIGQVRSADFKKVISYSTKKDASRLILQVYLVMVR